MTGLSLSNPIHLFMTQHPPLHPIGTLSQPGKSLVARSGQPWQFSDLKGKRCKTEALCVGFQKASLGASVAKIGPLSLVRL